MTKSRNNKNKNKQKQSIQPMASKPVGRRQTPAAFDRITSFPELRTVVHNTEIISSVTTTLATSSYYTVFPVSPTFFTWLGTVADNYSKFKFRKFRVTYVPSVGTTTNGNVAMGFGYDMGDVYPTSTGGLATNQPASATENDSVVSCRPSVMMSAWEESSIEFPPDRMKENRFIDQGDWNFPSTTIASALQRNWGSDGYVLVNGIGPASTNLGKIHIEYIIELINPIRASLQ